MKEKYWQQFISTGKVEDYLDYKNVNTRVQFQEGTKETGVENSESDYTDGNGPVSYSHWRV